MSKYTEQAENFLRDCHAEMKIEFIGRHKPRWDSSLRNTYDCTITTPMSTMTVRFYDSLYHTEKKTTPTAYDILACLQKYEVGSMDNFIDEFGYEIHCTEDYKKISKTYHAVVKEYNDVCRCFTEEQMDALREIS